MKRKKVGYSSYQPLGTKLYPIGLPTLRGKLFQLYVSPGSLLNIVYIIITPYQIFRCGKPWSNTKKDELLLLVLQRHVY